MANAELLDYELDRFEVPKYPRALIVACLEKGYDWKVRKTIFLDLIKRALCETQGPREGPCYGWRSFYTEHLTAAIVRIEGLPASCEKAVMETVKNLAVSEEGKKYISDGPRTKRNPNALRRVWNFGNEWKATNGAAPLPEGAGTTKTDGPAVRQRLSLSGGGMTDAGAQALAEAIRYHADAIRYQGAVPIPGLGPYVAS